MGEEASSPENDSRSLMERRRSKSLKSHFQSPNPISQGRKSRKRMASLRIGGLSKPYALQRGSLPLGAHGIIHMHTGIVLRSVERAVWTRSTYRSLKKLV